MAPNYLKHKNGYEISGLWYPRVTSICGIIAKPGLERWFANQGSFALLQKRRKKTTDWGNLIHETVESIFLGKLPKINPSIRPSINAFLTWFQKHRIDVFGVEKRIISKEHSYSGTLDVLAEIDGQTGVLDLKTSKEIWDDYFVQTAAYYQAYNEKAKQKIKTYWILRIDQYQQCKLCKAKKREKSGAPVIQNSTKGCNHQWSAPKGVCELKEVSNHKIYLDTFLNAKKLWQFSNRRWLSRIENYPDKKYLREQKILI